MWYWQIDRNRPVEKDSAKTDLFDKYGQLICDNGAKAIQRRRDSLFINVVGTSAYADVKKQTYTSTLTSDILKKTQRTSLVVQWLRICLPMQGTRVQSLVWEDSTCCGTTKPVHHNYWACAPEPACHNYWACVPQLLKLVCLEPMLCNKTSHHNEKLTHRNEE